MPMQIIIEHFIRSAIASELKLNADDRILLFILASMMGTKKECNPSYDYLLEHTGIGSCSTLKKSMTKLESLKILNIKRKYKNNNRYSFYPQFINSCLQICNQKLQKCRQMATNLYANNISNNIKNNGSNFSSVDNQSNSYVKGGHKNGDLPKWLKH